MKKINIREALLKIDKDSYCQYDLTSLYEACKLDDEDKCQLVKYIDAYEHPSVISGFLESKCQGVNESFDDDDVSDIKGAEKIIAEVNDLEIPAIIDVEEIEETTLNEEIVDEVEDEEKETLDEAFVIRDANEVRKYVWKKILPFDSCTDDDSYYWDFDQDIRDGLAAKLVTDELDIPDNAHYKFSLPEADLNFFFVDNPEYCYFVIDKNYEAPDEGINESKNKRNFRKDGWVLRYNNGDHDVYWTADDEYTSDITNPDIMVYDSREMALSDITDVKKMYANLTDYEDALFEPVHTNDLNESKSIKEDSSSTRLVEDNLENYIIEALGIESYTQGFMDTVVKFITPYKEELLNFEYMILRTDDFEENYGEDSDLVIAQDNSCDVVVYKNVNGVKFDYITKHTVQPHEESNSEESLWVIEEQLDEDLEKDLERRYTISDAHTSNSVLRNIEELAASESVKEINPVVKYDTQMFEMISADSRVFYLIPVTTSQFDVYDADENLITKSEFAKYIVDEVLLDKSNIEFVYQIVGGGFSGIYSREEMEALPCFSGNYTDDQSDIRANGGFTSREELDNQPVLDGYVGPMMNGWRNHKMVLRYETQEIYDRLSEALDENPIIAWLGEHEQAWEDFTAHFAGKDISSLSDEEIIDWIGEHDQLYDDYVNHFGLDEDLDEGLWDDVKKVAKTVGNVAKDRWNDSYTKAVATGIKKNFEKSKLGQDLKKIGDSVKETDTYQNLKGKVDSAKQFIKDNKADDTRKASDMAINVRGKDYRMSDLKYKLGSKKLTPDEVAQMNAFKRAKVQTIVPRGTKPIKEGVEKYIIVMKIDGDVFYYNESENNFTSELKYATQYAEKEIALDDYNAIGKDGFDELEIRSIYDLPLLNKDEAFDVVDDEAFTKEEVIAQLEAELPNLGNEGVVRYGFVSEAEAAQEFLSNHYALAELDSVGSWFQIEYADPIKDEALNEALIVNCPSCNHNNRLSSDLACSTCNEPLLDAIIDNIVDDTSDNILIFNEDGTINKANRTLLGKGHKPIGETAIVANVTKDFFDMLTPSIHDRTSDKSELGKVTIDSTPKEVQQILSALKSRLEANR